MWNPNHQPAAKQEADDDSWEIRAFEEDTNNELGTTWPPRSYTCTFCRREFKSAQALGGHMNVHRRDRARLHQTLPPGSTKPATSASTLANNGLCLLYSLPNPNSFFSSTTINLVPPKYCPPPINFPVAPPHCIDSSLCHSTNMENSASTGNDNIGEGSIAEEPDLELRLGRKYI